VKRRQPIQKKPCAYCGREFLVDHRIGVRHRFCARPQCRRVSRRISNARWQDKPENRDYHRGPEQVERNRAWRKANPEYRALQRRNRKLRAKLGRAVSRELAAALLSCGLQDLNDRQLALVLGIARRVLGPGLQDSMAASLRRLMFEGYAAIGDTDAIS
jgi:hypothetical protein